VATHPPAGKVTDLRTQIKPAKPEYVRLITIAIDPGHGGEDPGALGAKAPMKSTLPCPSPVGSRA
jgi:N-acetylmuramoyl-L-alanine amidase